MSNIEETIKKLLAKKDWDSVKQAVKLLNSYSINVYSRRRNKYAFSFQAKNGRIYCLFDDGYSTGRVQPKNFFKHYRIEE